MSHLTKAKLCLLALCLLVVAGAELDHKWNTLSEQTYAKGWRDAVQSIDDEALADQIGISRNLQAYKQQLKAEAHAVETPPAAAETPHPKAKANDVLAKADDIFTIHGFK